MDGESFSLNLLFWLRAYCPLAMVFRAVRLATQLKKPGKHVLEIPSKNAFKIVQRF